MKLLRLGEKGAERPCLIDEEGCFRDVSSLVPDFGPDTLCDALIEKLSSANIGSLPVISDKGQRIGSPMARPHTIFCIGLNYSDHAEEAKMKVPDEPILFSKATAAFSGPNDDILYAPHTKKLDFEVELGVVIGKKALNISEDDAMSHVFGYTLVNDISERVWQVERSGQWIKGKSFPSFCPTGPYLVTKDEIENPQNLNLWLDVNGERQQTGHSSFMIFNVAKLVSYLSQFALLEPGDLICTGTPPGVGMGKKPPKFLKIGDEMTLGIDGLGSQKQKVVAL